MPHWYGFTEGVRVVTAGPLTEEEWGRLRERDAAFGFGGSRETWIATARSNPTLVSRAEAVARLLRDWGVPRVVAVGTGTGTFEYLLKSFAPEIAVRCGDWATESIVELKRLFTEAESVERMDIRQVTWVRDPDEVVLLNRVDMELRDSEWRSVFRDMAGQKVRRIIWIPCGLLTGASVFTELRGILAGIGRRRRLYRTGYLRTPARMVELFANGYQCREVIKRGDLPTWALHLNEGS